MAIGNNANKLTPPGYGVVEVTPHDTNNLTSPSRGLYIGTAGDVKIMAVNGSIATFIGAASGSVLPIQAKRVYATGTTATNIVAIT
jgi:hypothetical protein